jgi:hypothetical protein
MSWINRFQLPALLAAAICLTSTTLVAPTPAAAVAPTNTTVNCEPGQVANKDLGICQDPVCGPGTVRDPTDQTRACVAIPCPGGTIIGNQCVVNPPPPPKCPNGGIGRLEHLSTGVTIIVCPKTLPPETTNPPPPPPVNKVNGPLPTSATP